MNINQADECTSCHHKTKTSTKNQLLKSHTALSTEADVITSATNGKINVFLSVIIAAFHYSLLATREKDLVTNYNLLKY
jgi:predicted CXXCH cytochrome family protein